MSVIYNKFPVPPMISTYSFESIGLDFEIMSGGGGGGSAAWPTANKAIYVPFSLNTTIVAKLLWTANGSNASQTRDVGIYSSDGVRIVSSGSTAGSGTSTLQTYDIADTTLGPGRFYFALASSGTSNQFLSIAPAVSREKALGMYDQASAFALPATATFATITATYLPLFGLSTVTTV